MSDNNLKSVKAKTGPRLLPKSFSPSINEVIIGRGKKVNNHSGNENFRDLIDSKIHEYEEAENKTAKSAIIFQMLQHIKRGSPETGGFVKKDAKTKRWYAVEDTAARTTTAQAFRDALSNVYRSSKQYKQKRRWRRKGDEPSVHEESTTTPSSPSSSRPVVSPPTGAGRMGLGDILDTALGIMGDMMPALPDPTASRGSTGNLVPIAPKPEVAPSSFLQSQVMLALSQQSIQPMAAPPANIDLEAIWNGLGIQTAVTGNPFEPTPISPTGDSTKLPCDFCWLKQDDVFGTAAASASPSAASGALSLREALASSCTHNH
ncbi:Nitrilase family, member 2 [Seminavis robusta]|uniref:Nitrilase family, member 2 n=1 Tax=Seminavis robusta TaxID=568900 RepID=A0A9N8DHY9_9STRA|nr:Nitrilase family, member 2 [Seminavis robusta]|eukprot:Sro131_g062180.1 Nitrilase family, member 2 (318) ;mRNA; f:27456-28536